MIKVFYSIKVKLRFEYLHAAVCEFQVNICPQISSSP